MKKFEEEMKEWFGSPTGFNMEFQSGYEAYSALVKRFKGYISSEEYEKYIKESTNNTSKLLGQINDLKDQLEKQQPEIPEVPQFVAYWLDRKPLYAVNSSIPVEIIEWLRKRTGCADLGMNINLLIELKVNGYTVAKEKRFYLKHIDMSKRDVDGYAWYLKKYTDGELDHKCIQCDEDLEDDDIKFTQQEINSMAAESYEQIEVEE
jgi:Protein of unknown function (DUF1642).